MNLRSMLGCILVSSLGLAGSVVYFELVIHAADPEVRTSAYCLMFIVPLAIFGFPGLTSGFSPMSAFPPKVWIGGSLAAVAVFALYNFTWGFARFFPLDSEALAMSLAVGPLFLALLWLLWESMKSDAEL